METPRRVRVLVTGVRGRRIGIIKKVREGVGGGGGYMGSV